MKTRSHPSPPRRRAGGRVPLLLVSALIAVAPLSALEPPTGRSPVAERAFRHPDLRISAVHRAPAELPPAAAARALQALSALGVTRTETARLDLRGGRWATLLPGTPLLPGLAPSGGPRPAAPGAPVDPAPLERQAWEAFAGYLRAHPGELEIDLAELFSPGRVEAHSGGVLIQIHVARAVRGVPVRDSYLTAVVNRGNLVLFGARQWGDVEVSTEPSIAAEEALARLQTHLGAETITGFWGKHELLLVPLARGRDAGQIVPGEGYAHRLVWSLKPRFAGDHGSWEGLVDAHSGELVAFEDHNHYATTREVKGGVYPVSNDGTAPDGVEQAGWPMPFDALATGGGTVVTDSGGNAPLCVDGSITSSLAGPFVRMSDSCGAIGLSGAGSLDFGTSGGTDCATPGFGGAGNTHASRTGFHELNRLREQAKGQLPGNGWLDQQLTANMNINDTCNAFWNGSTVNFYRSGGGCANTGEIAGVFDHEWGHGMDDNDVVPTISSPGEGIADLYMYLRLDTSCIGRGFRLGTNCTGFGDACTACDGVREIDWAKRASGAPHDTVWADRACFTFPPTGHPCGGVTHCEGQVYAEAVYDLVNRDLPCLGSGWDIGTGLCTGGATPVMDHNTAFEIGTRLTYLGAGAVGSWFTCDTSPPLYGGCNADGGYLNYLAADDDNGNLNDGTPHMPAIFDAFDRHGIACDTPTVADSGCAGAPTSAPVVTATARDRGAELSWGAVAGATKYEVFRTDGVFACDFGKIKVGETTGPRSPTAASRTAATTPTSSSRSAPTTAAWGRPAPVTRSPRRPGPTWRSTLPRRRSPSPPATATASSTTASRRP